MNPDAAGSHTPLAAADAALVDFLHDGFPLADRPFARIGRALGLAEDEVLERLRRLLASGVLAHLGPLYQIERAGGAWMLAALEVPAARFDAVAARINAHREVARSLRREHRLNLWFVVAAESPGAVAQCLLAIEAETGLAVQRFPTEREYRVAGHLGASPAALAEEPG